MNYLIVTLFLSAVFARPNVDNRIFNLQTNDAASSDDISLVTFDGNPDTTFQFRQTNDPVMGGVSSGSWSVNDEEGYGIEDGEVRDVPSLSAPGFIKATAHGRFNDASSAISGDLILHIRSSTAEYTGYRVSFGNTWNAFKDFKAGFSIEAGEEFSEVRIPFNTFSSEWDPATGDQTITCDEDPNVCPTAEDLGRIRRIEIWAEGVKGKAHMEVKSISAGLSKKQPTISKKTSSSSEVSLITFDGEPSTTFKFLQVNDPVMGGISSGSWSINEEEGFGIEEGTIRDVPSLQAPGFIKAEADGSFNDASSAIMGDLILRVRSTTPDYPAFRVSFGTYYTREFKADFSVPPGESFSEIRVPFNMFSDKWDPGTGDQTITCAEDPNVCPTVDALKNLRRISLMAEGAEGYVHLEVKSISAGIIE